MQLQHYLLRYQKDFERRQVWSFRDEMADQSQVEDGMASLNLSGKDNIFDKFKKSSATSSPERMKECFQSFDKDRSVGVSHT